MNKLAKALFGILVIASVSFEASGQKEFNNWFFGNGAALNFNSTCQSISGSDLYTDEGCASISDQNGQLLFYTNGVYIWDKDHKKINKNNPLFGHKSATQSALITSNPANSDEYFVFTIDEKAGEKGLCYSLISIGGIQNIKEEKLENNALRTPDLFSGKYDPTILKQNIALSKSVTEKLIAVPHADQKSIWILTHQWNSNTFIAYHLNKNGKIKDKVFSKAGSVHKNQSKSNNSESIGQMKVSSDHKKIALSISYREHADVELFDFDQKTGKVKLSKNIKSKGNAYGVEFSSDASKLYVSYLSGPNALVQYDLSNNAKQTIIFENDNEEIIYGALQIGPDQKIYVAKTTTYIDVINDPNKAGRACNLQIAKISLDGKFSVFGLPNKPVIINQNSISSDQKPIKSAVLNKPFQENKSDKKTSDESCQSTLKDVDVACQASSLLNAGGKNVNYKWSTGDTEREISVQKSDYYSVTLTGQACKQVKKVYVNFESKPTRFSFIEKFNPDGVFNNYFAFSINDVKDFEISFYKSNGKKLLSSTDPKFKWKGTDQKSKALPDGKYKWQVNYTPICDNQPMSRKGSVLISRKGQ